MPAITDKARTNIFKTSIRGVIEHVIYCSCPRTIHSFPERVRTREIHRSRSPLKSRDLRRIDAYWRACKYLALGMIDLQENPLLREPLQPEHIKNRLLGHWGSSPGLAFIYIHLNRLIKKYDLDMIFMAGPGHGAPGVLGPGYLEGTYSEIYPEKSEDEEGLHEFFKQFSFPGGIGSHCTPETPGSIHEGGELGYVLSHVCGAAFDNPELIVAAVVGDGESEQDHWQLPGTSASFSIPFGTGRFCPSCT